MDRLILPVLTVSAAPVITDLAARPGVEIVGVVVDLGHDPGLDALRDMALGAGAVRCHVVDKRDALAEGVLWPALRAGALAAAGAPVYTALSLPVVAEAVADVARFEEATGAVVWADLAADRRRLRALLAALMPGAGLVSATGTPAAPAAANLWATVAVAPVEGPAAHVEGPGLPARHPRSAASAAGRVTVRIGFERGVPVRLNGVPMTPAELIDSLATLAEDQGVAPWRVRDHDSGEAWIVRAPAARVLQQAMAVMTARSVDGPTADLLEHLAGVYADLVREGLWCSPARAGIDALVDRVLASAGGDVTLQIDNGRIEGDA
jgi:argininosuccinate synthase